MSRRTYLFASGGTGGHLFPGIAVAERLTAEDPAARVLFAGSDRPVERDIMAGTPFEHRVLPAVSLAGARRHPLRFGERTWRAYRAAMRLIAEVRPQAVIGCGGFASAAPVFAAHRRKVLIVLLEQNVIPGRTTRWLSRLGGTVCVTFEQTASRLPRAAKTVVTGNPVREDIVRLSHETHPTGPPTLLVLGGSQGAQRINDLMLSVAAEHRALLDGRRIVHQTGPRDEDRVRMKYAECGVDATVAAFFSDAAALYHRADVVVSRAGGTTLAELSCARLPALLLPYPHAIANHQWHNADLFCNAGAAMMIADAGDTPATVAQFAALLSSLLNDTNRRQLMSTAMSALARPHAAADIVRLLLERAGGVIPPPECP